MGFARLAVEKAAQTEGARNRSGDRKAEVRGNILQRTEATQCTLDHAQFAVDAFQFLGSRVHHMPVLDRQVLLFILLRLHQEGDHLVAAIAVDIQFVVTAARPQRVAGHCLPAVVLSQHHHPVAVEAHGRNVVRRVLRMMTAPILNSLRKIVVICVRASSVPFKPSLQIPSISR